MRQIALHGPWPPPVARDPTNRVSGDAAAIGLGRRLFFDARLSPSGKVSCSSCHRPERAWTDGRPRGIGLKPGPRNTPALFDLAGLSRYGWSGQTTSLWLQSIRPLLDAGEMGSSGAHVRRYLGSHPELAEAYAKVFGRVPEAGDDNAVLADAAKALAAYQETIVSGRSAFDEWRDALASGDAAAADYPPAAQRGASLFVGKGGCNTCHAGPRFSDGSMRDIGTAAGRGRDRSKGAPDALEAFERFADTSPHEQIRQQARSRHDNRAVRVPALRNVVLTAPYLHDGRAATLRAAIRAHGKASSTLRDHELTDLVRFLETLGERAR